jgi:hypothetical protein
MMAWAPAPMKRLPPTGSRVALGQKSVLATKEVALLTDIAVLTGSAFMVWGTTVEGNKWSTFWWIVSGITAMKILHDASRSA